MSGNLTVITNSKYIDLYMHFSQYYAVPSLSKKISKTFKFNVNSDHIITTKTKNKSVRSFILNYPSNNLTAKNSQNYFFINNVPAVLCQIFKTELQIQEMALNSLILAKKKEKVMNKTLILFGMPSSSTHL